MKNFKLIFLLFIFNYAYLLPQSPPKYAEMKNFVFESGDVLPVCKVAYRTAGTLDADSSNIILFLTWFGGNSNSLVGLSANNMLLDSLRYFIVCIDALGNGFSSSPSNTDNPAFPPLSIRDMVNSQYRLVTEVLKIKKVFAVAGGSMGSMQALEWAVAYPAFMQKIVAYSSTPKLTAYDLLWKNWIKSQLETGWKCGLADADIQKNINILNELLARTPEYVVANVSPDTFSTFFGRLRKEPSKAFTLKNYHAQLNAMIGHDIYKRFSGDKPRAAQAIRAKLLLIVNSTDILIRPEPAYELAKLSGCELFILNNDRGHLGVGHELKKCGEKIAAFLSE